MGGGRERHGVCARQCWKNHGRCLFRRVLLVVLPVRSNADLRALIVCTISSNARGLSKRHREKKGAAHKRTCELWVFRLEFIALARAVSRAAMDDDAERGRGGLARLAREEAIDMIRRRLAVIKNCLGGLVGRRHDLLTVAPPVRKG